MDYYTDKRPTILTNGTFSINKPMKSAEEILFPLHQHPTFDPEFEPEAWVEYRDALNAMKEYGRQFNIDKPKSFFNEDFWRGAAFGGATSLACLFLGEIMSSLL